MPERRTEVFAQGGVGRQKSSGVYFRTRIYILFSFE